MFSGWESPRFRSPSTVHCFCQTLDPERSPLESRPGKTSAEKKRCRGHGYRSRAGHRIAAEAGNGKTGVDLVIGQIICLIFAPGGAVIVPDGEIVQAVAGADVGGEINRVAGRMRPLEEVLIDCRTNSMIKKTGTPPFCIFHQSGSVPAVTPLCCSVANRIPLFSIR